MKLFFTVLFSICAIGIYCQTYAKNATQESNGSYFFTKAELTVYNYQTQAVIFTKVFNDTGSLSTLADLPVPTIPVFLSAHIQDGFLRGCTLWNNGKNYGVINNGLLLISSDDEENSDISYDDVFSAPYGLSPLYSLKIEGKTATLNLPQVYANSQYNFTLEGIFTISLTRD